MADNAVFLRASSPPREFSGSLVFRLFPAPATRFWFSVFFIAGLLCWSAPGLHAQEDVAATANATPATANATPAETPAAATATPAETPLTGVVPEISDASAMAQRRALDLAGAFSNEGFKIRDGRWTGVIQPGQSAVLEVNLLKGNQYWFSAAIGAPGGKPKLTLFDANSIAMTILPYSTETQYAAGYLPDRNGTFYLKLEMPEGEQTSFCVVYSYK